MIKLPHRAHREEEPSAEPPFGKVHRTPDADLLVDRSVCCCRKAPACLSAWASLTRFITWDRILVRVDDSFELSAHTNS